MDRGGPRDAHTLVRHEAIFVQASEDRVAAVVTVPDTKPRGVAIVLAGTGRHNVIGGTMAGMLSTRLAALDIAAVRLDYPGVGDSPGTVRSWSPSTVDRALDASRATVRTVCEALAAPDFVAVGTCYGSRVALELVGEPACVGAVCLAPPILDPGAVASAGGALGGGRLSTAVRSTPVVRTLARPVWRLVRTRRPSRRVFDALTHLDRARVTFLYGSPRNEDHYSARAHESIQSALDALPAPGRTRFAVRMLELGPLTTFDGLDRVHQEAILDVVVPDVVACFAPDGLAADQARQDVHAFGDPVG